MGHSSSRDISEAQETLYAALLSLVKQLEPESVLDEFKQLFIHQVEVRDQETLQAVYDIVLANDRQAFFYTLKRCCFILINNWGAARIYEPIHQLIATLSDSAIHQFTYSHNLRKLRRWLSEFVNSQDYKALKLFTERYSDKGRWSQRYASYLLVPQYSDSRNPLEQREAARALSKQLRDRFRFDLAMYVARSQANPRTASTTREEAEREEVKNPTRLGDSVLRLIKMIVLRRGKHSYENLAQLFLQQTEHISYGDYKAALLKYLVFSVDNQGFVQIFSQRLSEKLDDLHGDRDSEALDEELAFRTCNRVIQFLTTENDETPTPLFNLLISQGGPLTLVIVLLKLVLIAPNTRNRLEYCVAKLIHHYEEFPADECHWFINFLEVFSVTFAIYVEDVQYNLVRISSEGEEELDPKARPRTVELEQMLDDYRIFSQRRANSRFGAADSKDLADSQSIPPAANLAEGEQRQLENTVRKASEIRSKLENLAHKSKGSSSVNNHPSNSASSASSDRNGTPSQNNSHNSHNGHRRTKSRKNPPTN